MTEIGVVVNAVKRPDVRHLRRHAEQAVARRLQYPAPWAVRAVERDGRDVLIRLNSGGNSVAVENYLLCQGYAVEDAGNPDGYGCALRVLGERVAGFAAAGGLT